MFLFWQTSAHLSIRNPESSDRVILELYDPPIPLPADEINCSLVSRYIEAAVNLYPVGLSRDGSANGFSFFSVVLFHPLRPNLFKVSEAHESPEPLPLDYRLFGGC